eukprot:1011331-Pyramimonas_sp.AAC.2
MACLVADGAKNVAGMGRGAHRARTSMRAAAPPILTVQNNTEVLFFLSHRGLYVKCAAGMGSGAHRARTSGATPKRERPPYLSEAMPC